MKYLLETRVELIVSRFELKTFVSNTMLNHHLLKKFKLIGRVKFNHLIFILTLLMCKLKLIFNR